jgi:hypothetical protein
MAETITKEERLIIEDLDLAKRKEAIQVMDEMRKRHKLKAKEKTSVEIIRHFRNRRYKQ